MDNYFTIFGLSQSFDIDTKKLAEYYRNLQRTVHPDKFVNAPERERRLAMQKAVQINEAFQTLKNPLKRGLYMLQLHGMDINDSSVMDAEFLMLQMELHEQLNSIKQQSNPVDSLNSFLNQVQHEQHQLNILLSEQFSKKSYQLAYENIQKLQFFTKLYEEALKLEENLL
ncbi:Fe-S protein assembly co-chaperone HscB [Candidatus Halobeggiatoa sp. HSG11]|nr:Fe-S protein assembly co-chaperone HscB [Candidatus Halobeggiatoa sp. HSG11]